jgi:hypothetical protein
MEPTRCCPSIAEHVSRAENGAEQAEKRVSGSGALRGNLQNTEYSGSSMGSVIRSGAVGGCPRNWWRVEWQFSSLRSYTLIDSPTWVS